MAENSQPLRLNRAASRAETTRLTVPLWCLALPLIVLGVLIAIVSGQPDGRLHVWVLDVGQGDAILVRTPAGHTAVIDGGPAATPLLNGIGAHLPFWQRDVDLLVLTHPHEDHMLGFGELLGRYRVGEVVQTEFTATTGIQAQWPAILAQRHIPVHYARRGDSITFGGEPDLRFDVLSPITPDASHERHTTASNDDINNTSIVLQLTYGDEHILLEGDAQTEAEAEMVRYEGAALHSQVLKVGHHGSKTSSSPPFLQAVAPLVAIISVGAGNKFGHPAPETLDALQAAGAKVYRTDTSGTVEVIAEKERLWVRPDTP